MEVTSPQNLLTISKMTRRKLPSALFRREKDCKGRTETGKKKLQTKVTFCINWRAADAQPGPELTPGNTDPSTALPAEPGTPCTADLHTKGTACAQPGAVRSRSALCHGRGLHSKHPAF